MSENQTLEYAHLPPQPLKALLRISWACAIIPLIIGLVTFGLFGLSHHARCVRMGLLTILMGMICTLAAAVCMSIYVRDAKRAGEVEWERARRMRTGIVLLFLLDYVAAGVCCIVAIGIISRSID
jgi:hypothetical protein